MTFSVLAAVLLGAFNLYNVVPFSSGDEARTAQELREYAKRTGEKTILYTLTLRPMGKPAIESAKFRIESYKRLKQELSESGIRLGVLVQAIIGHGWPVAERESEPWQRTIDINGKTRRFCPLDQNFLGYVREVITLIAQAGAPIVMMDDDCRSFSPDAECFCPLHVAEFNRLTGKNHTGESLRAAIRSCRLGDEVEREFAALQRESITALMRVVREALDAVNPKIDACCCTAGQNREVTYVADYARALAAKGAKPMARVDNGYYVENSPREFPGVASFTMGVCEYLKDKVVMLDEADTCPHFLWAKSSASFYSHLTLAALCGCQGAKVWFVNCHLGEVEVSRNYTDILARHRGRLEAISRLVEGSEALGVIIPCTDKFASGIKLSRGGYQVPPTCDRWVEGSFGLMGVPFRTSFDKTDSGLYALGGNLSEFSYSELTNILSHQVIVDSDAAKALIRKGFGEFIGVTIRDGSINFDFEADDETGEIAQFSHGSGAPWMVPAAGGKVLSWLCSRQMPTPMWNVNENPAGCEKVAPGTVLFKNKLGGTVLVTAWHSHPFVLQHRTTQRQRWLARMLSRLNGAAVDNLVANDQDVMVMARRLKGGADLIAAFNLNFDSVETLHLRRAKRPAAVSVLAEDGRQVKVEFSWKDGIMSVPLTIAPYSCGIIIVN